MIACTCRTKGDILGAGGLAMRGEYDRAPEVVENSACPAHTLLRALSTSVRSLVLIADRERGGVGEAIRALEKLPPSLVESARAELRGGP